MRVSAAQLFPVLTEVCGLPDQSQGNFLALETCPPAPQQVPAQGGIPTGADFIACSLRELGMQRFDISNGVYTTFCSDFLGG